MTTIHFDYNEDARKWEVSATAISSEEAKQAFGTVLLAMLEMVSKHKLNYKDTIVQTGEDPFTFRIFPVIRHKTTP